MQNNYYNILGCDSSATYDEIRRGYQELVRQNHPDKQKEKNSGSKAIADCQAFILIDKAWKVLRDNNLRREYDRFLLQHTIDNVSVIYAELKLDELHFEQEIAKFTCRCGSEIEISREDFLAQTEEQDKLYFGCNECSNTISVSR